MPAHRRRGDVHTDGRVDADLDVLAFELPEPHELTIHVVDTGREIVEDTAIRLIFVRRPVLRMLGLCSSSITTVITERHREAGSGMLAAASAVPAMVVRRSRQT